MPGTQEALSSDLAGAEWAVPPGTYTQFSV